MIGQIHANFLDIYAFTQIGLRETVEKVRGFCVKSRHLYNPGVYAETTQSTYNLP